MNNQKDMEENMKGSKGKKRERKEVEEKDSEGDERVEKRVKKKPTSEETKDWDRIDWENYREGEESKESILMRKRLEDEITEVLKKHGCSETQVTIEYYWDCDNYIINGDFMKEGINKDCIKP